jgi:AraC-like DNA-binding protein
VTTRDLISVPPRVLECLAALGVPVEGAVARAGLADGRATPVTITTEAFFAFWRAVDEMTDRRDLGLVLGAESPEAGYSVASAAALHARDLAEALKTLARYKRLTCPEAVEVEVDGGEACIRFHWVLATSEVPRLLVDSTFASFAALARRGTGGKVGPSRVELARRAADIRLLRSHFDCPVAFGAPVDRIVFEQRALSVPFVTADAQAFSRVVPGLEAELVRRSRAPRSLSDEVRVAIARDMSRGARPSVSDVAHRLHLSPRTLQRRLGEERTSYQEQLDQVRRTSACRMLANTELDPVDIAFLLGFAEPNSFSRAFRAWERTTPIRWRERSARA